MKKTINPLTIVLFSALLASCGGASVPDGGGVTPPTTGGSPGGAAFPTELQGDWQAGAAAPVGYYDPNSGAWQGATGSSFILKLRADGTYQYTGLLAVTTGSCQSKILSTERGTVTFKGVNMTFAPTQGDVQSTVCGGPVKHAPVTPSARRWALSMDDYGKEALFIQLEGGSGAPNAFYRTDRPGRTFPRSGISGTVTAPEGRTVSGTLVVACYVDDPECLSPATKLQL